MFESRFIIWKRPESNWLILYAQYVGEIYFETNYEIDKSCDDSNEVDRLFTKILCDMSHITK